MLLKFSIYSSLDTFNRNNPNTNLFPLSILRKDMFTKHSQSPYIIVTFHEFIFHLIHYFDFKM